MMLTFFGPVPLFASWAALSANRRLRDWAAYLGAQNPLVARIVWLLAALVGRFAVTAAALSLFGFEI